MMLTVCIFCCVCYGIPYCYIKCKACWTDKSDEDVIFEMFGGNEDEEKQAQNLDLNKKEDSDDEEYESDEAS